MKSALEGAGGDVSIPLYYIELLQLLHIFLLKK